MNYLKMIIETENYLLRKRERELYNSRKKIEAQLKYKHRRNIKDMVNRRIL